jgi:hypothetical protein
MPAQFDRRVVPEPVLDFVRACQKRVPCHLGGGAALSGVWLRHRLSRDIDLFCHERDEHRDLVRLLPEAAAEAGGTLVLQRDSGGHARGSLKAGAQELDVDVVFDPARDLEAPPAPIEEVIVESLTDLRASKITCLLSRAEPRDLVDVLFLERAGYPPERDLEFALRKDGGIDPGILAWLLTRFPIEPLPVMLEALTSPELEAYRDDLSRRLRSIALGP